MSYNKGRKGLYAERMVIMAVSEMKRGLKEPGSAITHMIGAAGAVIGAPPLLLRAAAGGPAYILAMAAFLMGMFLLYSASSLYHGVDGGYRVNVRLKKMDHMMIYMLIAGTYTPVCVIALGDTVGYTLLAIIWGMALFGIFQALFWVHCPKWVSSVIYIAMGWTCVLAFSKIVDALPSAAFAWLLAGGIIYTAGGVIYALKLPLFNARHKNFGSHEVFHLFCLGGSFCHYVLMYQYIAVV